MSNVSVPRGSGLFIQVYSSKELWPVIATLFFMVGLLVLVLNAVTVLLFSRSPSLRSPSNMMTASLAVTDLSLGVVIIWCALGWVPSVMISATLLAPVPCLVMICWFSTSGVASMLNITLIAADRYLYVVHPYFHTRLVTPRSTAACVTVVWLLAVAYGTVPAYAHKPDHDDSLCDFPDVSLVGHFVYASFGVFSFSCTTTLVLYCLVARLVYKKLRNPLPVPVPACGLVNGCRREGPLYFNNTCTRESHLRKVLQSVRAPAVVFGVFVLCWTPHFVAQFIHVASPVRVPYRAFCTIGGLLNSAMNFFVYVILNPNFRKELVSRWKRRISAEVTDGRASRVTPRTSRVTTSRVTVPVL